MSKMLLVDGPLHGQVKDVPDRMRYFDAAVPPDVRAPAQFGAVELEVVTYHEHWFRLFGRRLRTGSVATTLPDGRAGDLFAERVFWELLASDLAKDLASGGP
jgi:hypothetical protein